MLYFTFTYVCEFSLKGGLSFYQCRQWKVAQPYFKLFIACPRVTIRSVYDYVADFLGHALWFCSLAGKDWYFVSVLDDD